MPRHSSPTSTTRELPWTRAAHTTMLPDRWVAWGRLLGDTIGPVVGNPIAEQVVLGPNPDPNAVPSDLLDVLDADAAWIVDFDVAEAQGMALRLPLTGSSSRGLNAVFVAGVKTFADADGAARIADLLERPPPHRRPRARPAGNTDEQHHRRSRGLRAWRRPARASAHRARRPLVHAGGHQRHRWRRRYRHRRPATRASARARARRLRAHPARWPHRGARTRPRWPPSSGRRPGATTSNR